MLLLHTTDVADYVTNGEKKKPYTYKIYDFTTGGINIPINERFSLIVSKKQEKWRLVALAYVLDIRRVKQYMQ